MFRCRHQSFDLAAVDYAHHARAVGRNGIHIVGTVWY